MALNKDGSSRKKNSERQAQPQLFTRQIEPFTGEITIQWISIRKNDCTIHWIGYLIHLFNKQSQETYQLYYRCFLFIGQRTLIASASKELKDSRRHRFYSGMSLKFQVARLMIQVDRESNNQGFCLVLFFFYFPTKVGGRHVYSSKGTSPAPRPLMTSLLLNILLS